MGAGVSNPGPILSVNAMPYNKKSLLNLKRTPKGVSGNPAGRQPKLCNAIASIPPDAQKKIGSNSTYAEKQMDLSLTLHIPQREIIDL